MAEPHLVLGAGAFSRAAIRALLARGEAARVLTRSPVSLEPGVELRIGDARSLGTVLDAAKGAASILHGAAPPLSRWSEELGSITDTVVEAAGLTGAPLVMPGPNWSVRPVPGVPLPPTLFEPDTLDQIIPPGRQRQWIEIQLQQLAETRNVRTMVLRSSDWFGPHVRRSLLSRSLAAAKNGGSLTWFAPLDIPHDLVFVEDVAEVAVNTLLDTSRPVFEVVHVTGNTVDATTFARTVGEALGRAVPISRANPLLLGLKGLFDTELWAWRQSLPIWEAGLQLDDRETRARGFVPTPLLTALKRSLHG